jgi:hypothetical protein
MAEKLKFKVLRRHEGGRMYEEGETREGTLAELGHLVPRVLERMDGAAKAEAQAPANKMEPAPANKAEPANNQRNRGKPRGE